MKTSLVIYLLYFLNCIVDIYRCKLHIQFTDQELECMNAAQWRVGVVCMHTDTWTKSCYCKAARACTDPPVPGKLAACATRNKPDLEQPWSLFSK